MRPALQLLPLLAFLLLQLHHHAHADDCESAACGNLTIRYPFWVGSSNQPWSNCGHPAFKIQCSDDGTVASLKGTDTDIHILSINYTDRSFVASQTRVAAGNNGVCRADVNGSTIIGLSVFTISISRNRALCFLYNCNGTEPSGPGYVNATSTCSAPVYAYLAGSMDMSAIEMGGCTLSYVPVREQEPETMSAANYTRLLKDGYVVDWPAPADGDCSACTASGGKCRNVNAVFACVCPNGNQQGSTCATEGEFQISYIFF